MSYQTVMVQLELGRSNAAPLGVAHDLARRAHASVTGIAAAQPIQMVVADGYLGAELVRQDTEWLEQEAKAIEAEFRTRMSDCPEGISWLMEITPYSPAERIAGAAASADIVIVGVAPDGIESAPSSRRVDADDVIMEAGRPVLVVPLSIERFEFRCAVVAWKESREARRALADALPMLRLMEKVVIVEVTDLTGEGEAQVGLDRMVAWLARHRVAAIPRIVLSERDEGKQLLDFARAEGAELLVAGAYGHTRFREWVLGGATRTLLHQTGCCLLLSH